MLLVKVAQRAASPHNPPPHDVESLKWAGWAYLSILHIEPSSAKRHNDHQSVLPYVNGLRLCGYGIFRNAVMAQVDPMRNFF